jgi:hypothetical protein
MVEAERRHYKEIVLSGTEAPVAVCTLAYARPIGPGKGPFILTDKYKTDTLKEPQGRVANRGPRVHPQEQFP